MMKARIGLSPEHNTPSQQIDAIISEHRDWQGKRLAQLRSFIKKVDPAVIEEVKWKKPTNPLGFPVWSHDGIICTGGLLKNAVRLTFLKGAQLKDPKKLFNASLKGNALRAIDFYEGDSTDAGALKALVHEGVRLNASQKAFD